MSRFNTKYIISDLHLGHDKIIHYCNRPFDDVEQMNETIVNNWNNTVSDDDTVLLLGDVKHPPSSLTASEWLEKLNGSILLVRGNHDNGVSQNTSYHVVESCVIHHGRFEFYLEHYPVEDSLFWQIHGHVHNNDMRNHPFINKQNRNINVSAELLDYTPLGMDELIYHLEKRERFTNIEHARSSGKV